jgi:hypothetical protein
VLTETRADVAADGTPSKARHTLARSVAAQVAHKAADLLEDRSLYPTIDLS